MTIIIPTWIIVILLLLFTIKLVISIRRGAMVIRGMKKVWPLVKEFLETPPEDVEITVKKE